MLLVDLRPVDREDHVALLEARLVRGAVGLDRRVAAAERGHDGAVVDGEVVQRLDLRVDGQEPDADPGPRQRLAFQRLVEDRPGDVDEIAKPMPRESSATVLCPTAPGAWRPPGSRG